MKSHGSYDEALGGGFGMGRPDGAPIEDAKRRGNLHPSRSRRDQKKVDAGKPSNRARSKEFGVGAQHLVCILIGALTVQQRRVQVGQN